MEEKRRQFVEEIQQRAFNLLRDFTNYNQSEKGYGLTLDHNENPQVASIATTGFMLSGYVIAVEYGYMSYEEARKIVIKTLETLYYHVPHYKGFFVHFVDIHTAKRAKMSEYSTIDTTLCISGILTADAYFKDARIKELSDQIVSRIEWDAFVHEHEGKTRFYMSYNQLKKGAYVTGGKTGYIFQWHMLAEQIPMYLIAAGSQSIDAKTALDLYEGFERKKGKYQEIEYYYSPGNTLFVYQYPLCWIDGKKWIDKDGFSWFENLRLATLGHKAWNLDHVHLYKTFAQETFGLTASSTPKGYSVFHCLPNEKNMVRTDGTVAPNAMVGSLITNPDIVFEAMCYMKKLPHVWQEYGFIDAYNFEGSTKWYSKRYITIDKGLELLMANAYLSQNVVDAFMSHPMIQKGLEVLQWKRV